MNSAANFVFKSKTGLPRVVLVLRWVLFFQKYSSLHSRSLNNTCSDPRLDTGSLMQLESRRAVPQASQPPIIQSLSQDLLIIPQLDGREVKTIADFGITHISFIFLFFDSKPGSCQPICGIIIANKSFSSAKAALVCSFRASGKNRRHLGCGNAMRSGGCAVQNKEITLNFFFLF